VLGYLLGTRLYNASRGSTPVTDYLTESDIRADRVALREEIHSLREELATMALVNKVVVRTLVSKSLCSAQEFEDLFHAIDMEDGIADGKYTEPKLRDCPHCGKRMQRGKSVCIYCGEDAGRNITL
jgi:hypothetical protein